MFILCRLLIIGSFYRPPTATSSKMILSPLLYNPPEKTPYGIKQLLENSCFMWHQHYFQPSFHPIIPTWDLTQLQLTNTILRATTAVVITISKLQRKEYWFSKLNVNYSNQKLPYALSNKGFTYPLFNHKWKKVTNQNKGNNLSKAVCLYYCYQEKRS